MIRLFLLLFIFFIACSDINSGWSVSGGGYMNLRINDTKAYTDSILGEWNHSDELKLDIHPDDGNVKLRPNKHFVTFLGKNDDGDRLQIMVYKPELGMHRPQTNINYTYLILGNSNPARIIDADSSYVKFDQRDTIWSADLRLIFNHCYGENCDSTRVIISGRMRYWVDPDDR